MAIYFLNLKTFGRSNGSSAVGAAAYRSGERLHDERSGKTYDHSDRLDVLHKEIVLPEHLTDAEMAWARDRENLWNAAEGAETRANARVAREYLVALPAELTDEQRLGLVRGFSHELTDRYRFVLDVAIHSARDFPGSDPRNYHAHLLATTREATLEGLGAKTALEMNDRYRAQMGLRPAIHELVHVRERWATVANEALQEAKFASRIDHRTLEAQGIDREPRPHIPKAAFEMERHGYRSVAAEQIRARYAERVAARQERAAAAGLSHAAQPTHVAQSEKATQQEYFERVGQATQPAEASRPQSLEDIRRQAREDWLRFRQERSRGAEPTPTQSRSRDDDYSL